MMMMMMILRAVALSTKISLGVAEPDTFRRSRGFSSRLSALCSSNSGAPRRAAATAVDFATDAGTGAHAYSARGEFERRAAPHKLQIEGQRLKIARLMCNRELRRAFGSYCYFPATAGN